MELKTLLHNCFGHLRNIFVHKWWVFYYACRCGIPIRGFFHDFSKFNPVEFWESVKYYQGTSSPIPVAKKEKGYSKAWQHHKSHNKHHYEYWTDNYDFGTTAIKMPFKYAVEMICDYLAAGRTYRGKDFTFKDELGWWEDKKKNPNLKIHEQTRRFLDQVFSELSENSFNIINKKTLKRIYLSANILTYCKNIYIPITHEVRESNSTDEK